MKVSRIGEKIKLSQVMDVSVDVHKDVLNLFFEIEIRWAVPILIWLRIYKSENEGDCFIRRMARAYTP